MEWRARAGGSRRTSPRGGKGASSSSRGEAAASAHLSRPTPTPAKRSVRRAQKGTPPVAPVPAGAAGAAGACAAGDRGGRRQPAKLAESLGAADDRLGDIELFPPPRVLMKGERRWTRLSDD